MAITLESREFELLADILEALADFVDMEAKSILRSSGLTTVGEMSKRKLPRESCDPIVLGRRLRDKRKLKGLTQAKLALLIQGMLGKPCSSADISSLERGKSSNRLSIEQAMASLGDLPADQTQQA